MKIVSFKGTKWNGTVTLYDPLTIEQEGAFELCLAAEREAREKGGGLGAVHYALLVGILACVQEWKLSGFPERVTLENFPPRPRKDRDDLIALLVTELLEIYKKDDPNA